MGCSQVVSFDAELAAALTLLDVVGESALPMSLRDIAETLEVSNDTVSDLTRSMCTAGLLRQTGDGKLALGPGVLRLASKA